MEFRKSWWVLLALAALLLLQGCCHTCARPATPLSAGVAFPAPPCNSCTTAGPLPPRVTAVPTAPAVPAVPATPAPGVEPTYVPNPAPLPQTPSPVVPSQGNYAPPPAPQPGVRLSPPEQARVETQRADTPGAEQPKDSVHLAPPQTAEPPMASIPPMAKDEPEATPPLPADIPHFSLARPRVAAGFQPFPDGLVWLQAHGYRTVLHVRQPGEDDSAARRQFEKNGLRYLTLEVSPAALSREVVAEFIRQVTDEANLPLFVYDKDGSLAGGLWYLYYRQSENLSDDKARAEAERVGFKQDQDGPHRTMWIAVQEYLKKQAP